MALFEEFPGAGAMGERTEQAWRLPMGAASPLWVAFGAAASAGVAYWWLTQWTRAVNVDALNPWSIVEMRYCSTARACSGVGTVPSIM